jgi:hypothetical protein
LRAANPDPLRINSTAALRAFSNRPTRKSQASGLDPHPLVADALAAQAALIFLHILNPGLAGHFEGDRSSVDIWRAANLMLKRYG